MIKGTETPAVDTAKINIPSDRGNEPMSYDELRAAQANAQPVEDEQHPYWCQQTDACVARNPFDGFIEHAGQHAQWETASDDVIITVDAFRRDAHILSAGQDKSDPLVRLTLTSTSLLNETDHSPVTASVEMGPDDVQLLVTFLQRGHNQITDTTGFDIERCVDSGPILRAREVAHAGDLFLALVEKRDRRLKAEVAAAADLGAAAEQLGMPATDTGRMPVVVEGHTGPTWATTSDPDKAPVSDVIYWGSAPVDLKSIEGDGVRVTVDRTDGVREDGTWGVIRPAEVTLDGNCSMDVNQLAELMAELAKVHAVLAAESSTS